MHWRTMMMSEFCGLLWVCVVLCSTGLGLVVVVVVVVSFQCAFQEGPQLQLYRTHTLHVCTCM